MSETKFTPGPWVSSRFGCQVVTGDSWSSICELKGDARWEDGRGSYEQEYDWQIQEANARLIAASPEMFDAGTRVLDYATLDTILADPKRHDNEVFGIRLGDLRPLAVALSKASGKEA